MWVSARRHGKLDQFVRGSSIFSFRDFEPNVAAVVDAERVAARLARQGFLAGVPLKSFDRTLGDCLLVAVTEKRTKAEIDAFAAALEKAVA